MTRNELIDMAVRYVACRWSRNLQMSQKSIYDYVLGGRSSANFAREVQNEFGWIKRYVWAARAE